jgi:hypothetical protein
MSAGHPNYHAVWVNHRLGPWLSGSWLWFSAVVAIAAIALLPFRARKEAGGRNAAGVLFSLRRCRDFRDLLV